MLLYFPAKLRLNGGIGPGKFVAKDAVLDEQVETYSDDFWDEKVVQTSRDRRFSRAKVHHNDR